MRASLRILGVLAIIVLIAYCTSRLSPARENMSPKRAPPVAFDGSIDDWYHKCSEMCVDGIYHRRTLVKPHPVVVRTDAINRAVEDHEEAYTRSTTDMTSQNRCADYEARDVCLRSLR